MKPRAPRLIADTNVHIGILLAPLIAFALWFMLEKSLLGFQFRVLGQATRAAKFAGFSENRLVWVAMLISGGLAGLAGILEATGTLGQLTTTLSPGYGFTAIIVAFLGRLNPLGAIPAGLLLALTYLGGDAAQINLGLPNAVTGIFQGILLFYLLGCDFLLLHRVKWRVRRPAKVPVMTALLVAFLVSTIAAATPLLLAATGELVVERVGVLNLGVEGMMLAGAIAAFATANETGITSLGVFAALVAGIALALIFAVISLTLQANQTATGLALTIFGRGFSALVGAGYVGIPAPTLPKLQFRCCRTFRCLGRWCSRTTSWSTCRWSSSPRGLVHSLHASRVDLARGRRFA